MDEERPIPQYKYEVGSRKAELRTLLSAPTGWLLSALAADVGKTLDFTSLRGIDGRPIWEPPLLTYLHLIDSNDSQPYTKRREAILEYTGGCVARTTEILDIFTETELLRDYQSWANEAITKSGVDMDQVMFFTGLFGEVYIDIAEVQNEGRSQVQHFDRYHFDEPTEGPWRLRTPSNISIPDMSGNDEEITHDHSEMKHLPQAGGAEPEIIGSTTSSRLPDSAHRLHSRSLYTPGLQLSGKSAQSSTSTPPQLAHRLISLCSDERIWRWTESGSVILKMENKSTSKGDRKL